MKKSKFLMLIISLFMISFSSFAIEKSCTELLTQNYSKNSHSYQMNEEELTGISEFVESYDISKNISFKVVEVLLERLKCNKKGVSFTSYPFNRSSCKEIVPGVSTSYVCYVESNVGYFVINMDMMSTVNVTFNRWD
jgi:hypothetical protein